MKAIVAPVSEIPPGTRRVVEVGGRSIGVFHVGDRFFAIRNRCPHQGGPLCQGHILAGLEADGPGSARVSEEPLLIACPWHGWEYDLETGQSFMRGSQPGVRSYDVRLEPGRSLVADAGAKLIPGPYKAETFAVRVEDDYVVIEV